VADHCVDRAWLAAIGAELCIPTDYGSIRGLIPQSEATNLVPIGANPDGRMVTLEPQAALAWTAMTSQAAAHGITLLPISGFRSIDRQTEIIREKRAAGAPIDEILRLVAAPGYSEHHTGRAIDISSPDDPPLEEAFEHTPAFRWLTEHAGSYGFRLSYPRGNPHGIGYEPWHWFWRPE
jgi:D-alanyl-D-alanine carboxypeptidase